MQTPEAKQRHMLEQQLSSVTLPPLALAVAVVLAVPADKAAMAEMPLLEAATLLHREASALVELHRKGSRKASLRAETLRALPTEVLRRLAAVISLKDSPAP